MHFSGENSSEKLFFAAKKYKTRGWSVIPLRGGSNPHDLKRPAIKWGRYQYTLARDSELEDWFLESGFGGLGIVCGQVSHLAVLDFDDPQKASEFRRLFPHLAQTYMVESGTRHLPHYYYHVPDHLSVYSRSAPGVDFRADGAYVVAPPTGYGDVQWRLINDQPLYVLSESDLRAIWRFLASPVSQAAQNGSETPSRSKLSQPVRGLELLSSAVVQDSESRRNFDVLSDDLLAMYRECLGQGRNNALFRVACIARDRGAGKVVVVRALANAHALQPAQDGSSESFRTRYAEALRTIESVFSHPARPQNKSVVEVVSETVIPEAVGIPTPSDSSDVSRLLNAVREWLLQNGCAAAARMLDGLLMAGIQVQSVFTERQACEWLHKFNIGRRSIMSALKSLLPDGRPLFEKIVNPLQTSPIPANAATHSENMLNKCDLVTGANRVKTLGRPAAYYRLPDPETLLQRLGLSSSQADTLSVDDLASPKAYRRALHRELVKRRPDSYSRAWLSDRLGISKWTSRRYETRLNVIVQPMYSDQPVTWLNLETLVPPSLDAAPRGTFLETEDGKRYPPLRAIAIHLLDAGRKLIHRTRTANFYREANAEAVGIPTPSSLTHAVSASTRIYANESKDSYSHSHTSTQIHQENPTAQTKSEAKPIPEAVGIPTPSSSDAKPSFWLCPSCLKVHIAVDRPTDCPRCEVSEWERVPDAIWRDQERLKIFWQTRWREKHPTASRRATPLPNIKRRRNSDAFQSDGKHQLPDPASEAAAQRIHERIPDLSRINASRLIMRYGIAQVEAALSRLKARGGIRNPAGFLISLLKSERLFYFAQSSKSRPLPTQEGSEWIQHMSESAYVGFLVNADDFVRKNS